VDRGLYSSDPCKAVAGWTSTNPEGLADHCGIMILALQVGYSFVFSATKFDVWKQLLVIVCPM
jgi:hypothetical protein